MASPPNVPLAAAPAGGQKPTARRAAPTTAPTGVATGVGVGVASGLAATLTVPAVPVIVAKQTADTIVAAFSAFFEVLRFHDEDWIRRTLGPRGEQQDVLDVLADENAREAEFVRKAMLRIRRDAPTLERIEDPGKRLEAVKALIARERHYAKLRTEAMAVRSIAAVDRAVLHRESPQGAFWKLDPNVRRHTRDCVEMAKHKFWPWVVLDDFHPPTHAGCRCGLFSYHYAIARGWMRPRDVQDVAVAIRRAAAAKLMLDEAEYERWTTLRDAMLSTGLTTPQELRGVVRDRLVGV